MAVRSGGVCREDAYEGVALDPCPSSYACHLTRRWGGTSFDGS